MKGGLHVKFDKSSEDFLAELTAAAYDVAILFKDHGSFVELELGLWDALRRVTQRNMCFSPNCGSSSPAICTLVKQFQPWSREAVKAEGLVEHSDIFISGKPDKDIQE